MTPAHLKKCLFKNYLYIQTVHVYDLFIAWVLLCPSMCALLNKVLERSWYLSPFPWIRTLWRPRCLPAFEGFRTQFTYRCNMAMDCTGVFYKIMLWSVLPQTGVARILTLQKKEIVEYGQCLDERLGFGCCKDPEVSICLDTVFWLLWRPRRPRNERVWLNNVPPGPPSFSQIETFNEMSVSSKVLEDFKKLISSIPSENCDIFVIKQYQYIKLVMKSVTWSQNSF